MATVMGNVGNEFYTAFYESDAAKRREALQAWVKSATPRVQAAVEDELKAFVEWVTEGRWTEDSWKRGEEKLRRIQNDYPLVMDIRLRKLGSREKHAGQLPDRVEYNPPPPVSFPVRGAPIKPAMSSRTPDDGDDYDDGGRSPNDDRSDSMNPNNDDYLAAMDNRSDQMNPNNDAYWSSRGR